MSLKVFVSGSAIYVFARVLSAMFPFIFLPIIARQLTVQDYGSVELIAIFNSLTSVLASSTAISTYSFFYHKTEDKNGLSASILYWILIPGTLITTICLFAASSLPIWYQTINFPVFILAGLVVMFISTQYSSAVSNILRMSDKPLQCSAYQLTGGLFSSILTTTFVILSENNKLIAYIGGSIVGSLFYAIGGKIVVGYVQNYSDVLCPRTIGHWKKIITFGFPLVPAALIESLLGLVDRFLVLRFYDNNTLGLYAMGSRMSSAVLIITQGVMFAFLPYALRLINEEPPEIVAKKLGILWVKLSGFFMFSICLLTVTSPKLIYFFGGAVYAEAYRVVPWISLALVFYSFTYFTYLGTLKAEKPYLFSVAVICGLVIVVFFPYCYQFFFGHLVFELIAVSRLFGSIAVVFVSLFFSQLHYPLRWSYNRLFGQWLLTLGFVLVQPHLVSSWMNLAAILVVLVILIPTTINKKDIQNILAQVPTGKN